MTPMATRRTTLDPARAERDRIVARLREQAPRLRARGISRLSRFGGFARAAAGSASDLDLVIEVDPESRFSLLDVVDLQDDLRALLGRPPHLAFAARLRPWLRQAILAEAIPIFRCAGPAAFGAGSGTSCRASRGSSRRPPAGPSRTIWPTRGCAR
jgi:predicted nucleotidyltransferase